MTPDIELLRELLAKATPGPWAKVGAHQVFAPPNEHGSHRMVALTYVDAANASLIAAAVNALPALLDEITRLHTLPAPSEAQPCERCAARDRDWWKPGPEDPYWMLEAEDGEWLKNAYSLLGTRDATKAIRFPTMNDAASHSATMKAGSKWWNAKPTEHSWISAESVTAMQKAKP